MQQKKVKLPVLEYRKKTKINYKKTMGEKTTKYVKVFVLECWNVFGWSIGRLVG